MTTDNKINLDGIRVNDIPLSQKSWYDISGDTLNVYNESINETKKLLRRRGVKLVIAPHEGGRRTKVRYLTENEIRKEKGIMAKPYDSLLQNVCWCLCMYSPVSLQAIAQHLDMESKIASKRLSGPLSSLWRTLGTDEGGMGVLKRTREKTSFTYELIGNHDPDELYQEHLKINRINMKKKREQIKNTSGTLSGDSASKFKNDSSDKGSIPLSEDKGLSFWESMLKSEAKRFGFNIDVKVDVNVTFSWKS